MIVKQTGKYNMQYRPYYLYILHDSAWILSDICCLIMIAAWKYMYDY
jgi:hypothetical protein